MYAAERQERITQLLASDGRVSVADLAVLFDVTPETARRDLAALERRGAVLRVHGGAVCPSISTTIEEGLAARARVRQQEKQRIAAAALSYLPSAGGSVLLDAGSTTGQFAAALSDAARLRVVTNSTSIAGRLVTSSGIDITLLGGRLREVTRAAVGPQTITALADIRVDVAFLGTNAITVSHGFSTHDVEEAAVKRAMAQAARTVVVLADSSKIGLEYFMSFATLAMVDVLVTDSGVPEATRDELTAAGLEVVIA